MRGALLEALWRQDEPNIFLSHKQFIDSFDGWDVQPHEADGKLVGVTMTKGPEFHFATFGQKWGLRRADIRHYLLPILKAHGYVLTKTPKDDTRQARFNHLIGFRVVGSDEFYTHYRLEELNA